MTSCYNGKRSSPFCGPVSPFKRYPRKPWTKFITAENQRYISNEAIDLLDKLLRYYHQERLTASEAQTQRYFDPVRTPAVDGEANNAASA